MWQPDTNNVQFLNGLINKVWFLINPFLPCIISCLQKPLYEDLMVVVDDIYGGTLPFTVTGIKLVDIGWWDTVKVDFDISYNGDCALSVRILKLKGTVKNIRVNGTLRVVLQPPKFQKSFYNETIRVSFVDDPRVSCDVEGTASMFKFLKLHHAQGAQIIKALLDKYINIL